jgi:hypothetical protein
MGVVCYADRFAAKAVPVGIGRASLSGRRSQTFMFLLCFALLCFCSFLVSALFLFPCFFFKIPNKGMLDDAFSRAGSTTSKKKVK